MFKQAQKSMTKLVLVSTAYGIPNVFRSNRIFNKIFWLIFLLISTAMASVYIYRGIMAYYNYEVVTLIKQDYGQPTEFPAITFCSLKLYHFENKSLNELIEVASFGYDYGIADNISNHLELVNTSSIGKCYRFNSGLNLYSESIPIKQSTFGGQFDSFSLAINAPDGLAVWIHNKSSPPTIELGSGDGNDPINILPGFQTNLAIEKIVEQKLEEPYNHCLQNVSMFQRNKTVIDYIKAKGHSYTQIKCLELCFDLDYITRNPCNCTNVTIGNVWSACWLDFESSVINSCTFMSKRNFYQQDVKEYCSLYCPLECDSVSFSVQINTFKALFFTDPNVAYFKIFYRSLKYTLITQKPKMLPFDVISNVGGTLGLFVGLSFVSLFEITEMVIEVILIMLRKHVLKKPVDDI